MSICANRMGNTASCRICACAKEVRDEQDAAKETAGRRPNDQGGRG